jgi:predicted transcriptional regulator
MDENAVNNLRAARESRMLSKAELARKAGISPLTIGRVESGEACRLSTMRKILEALEINLSDRGHIFPTLA